MEVMVKTFPLLALLRRNDRVLTAGFIGACIYAITIASMSPVLNAAPNPTGMVLRLSQTAEFQPAKVRLANSPETVVRTVVNRPAYAEYLREKNCLATAIYFEARGESLSGQKAVAEVVLARTRVAGRPKTICGVVYEGSTRRTGCQFSFTCDRVADRISNREAWLQAQRIATNVMRTGGTVNPVAGGATFYHADYVNPGWATRMVKVAEIGTHIFYRPQRGRTS